MRRVRLEAAGVPDSASKVSLTALDDYKVDSTVDDVRSSQMLLATKADGKQLYDAKEQGFFGALSGALKARQSSERLLVGLSGLVLFVGLALACRCASGSGRTSPGPTRPSPPRWRSARRPSGRCGPARSGSGRWSRTPPT
jgi:hypothetical protein